VNRKINRREFNQALTRLTAAGLALAPCGALLSACGSESSDGSNATTADPSSYSVNGSGQLVINLSVETGLSSVGSFIRKSYTGFNGGRGLIIVRTGASDYRAMSIVCPHAGAFIDAPSGGKAICPRHSAEFSVSQSNFGANIGGQSSSAATTFTATESGGSLTLS
jgi:nitrite reductase/ring-hydroxylating ferredoxin subunit